MTVATQTLTPSMRRAITGARECGTLRQSAGISRPTCRALVARGLAEAVMGTDPRGNEIVLSYRLTPEGNTLRAELTPDRRA